MSDEVLWTLDADASNVLSAFDEIDASLQNLTDALDQFASSTDSLSGLEDILSGLVGMVDDVAGSFGSLDEQIASIASNSDGLSAIDENLSSISGNAEETASSIESLDTNVQELGASAESITSLSDILQALQDVTDSLQTGFDTLNSSINDVESAIGGLESGIEGLGSTMQGVAASIDEVQSSLDGLSTSEQAAQAGAEETGSALEGLQGAVAPLAMISTAALAAGQQLTDMGIQGQTGFALVRDMAGASQSDLNNLEQAAVGLGDTMQQASAGFYQVASAGFSGAAGITVYKDATMAAKASGADAQDETSALTSILHAYNLSAQQAGEVTDQMTESIILGRQSAGQFASAIGPLAAAGHNVGLSFSQVAAAEATMTQTNPKVQQDAQQLRALFNATSLSFDAVAANAKKVGVSFDETHYKSLDLIGRLQYLAQISGGTNTVAFEKLVGGTNGLSAALALLSGHSSTYENNLHHLNNASGATAQAFQKYGQTIQAHLDTLNASISKFAMDAVNDLGPKIMPILDALTSGFSRFTSFLTNNTQAAMPILAGLATIIGGSLVAGLIALLAPAAAVLGVVIALGAAVAGVVYVVQNWSRIIQTVNSWLQQHMAIAVLVGGVLIGIAAYIGSLIIPSLIGMAVTAATSFGVWIAGAVSAAVATLSAAAPFILIGILIAAVVAGIILAIMHWSQIVGFLRGVWSAFAAWFMGILGQIGHFFAQIGSSIEHTAQSVWSSVVSWVIAQLNRLSAFIQSIFTGIQHGIQAAWSFIVNIARVGAAMLLMVVLGPILGIAALFVWLYNHNYYFKDLVDSIRNIITAGLSWLHSAWQNSINDIVAFWQMLSSQATQKWNQVTSAVTSAVTQVVDGVHEKWDEAMSWLSAAWDTIYSDALQVWMMIYTAIYSRVETITSSIRNAFNLILSILEAIWTQITARAESAWNSVSSAFQNGEARITGIIHSIESIITGVFNSLVSEAFSFGTNLINEFINGITSMAGAAGQAASNVVSNVAKFLGFHSPSEEGPGAEADKWAPNLMKMFIDGIRKSQGNLRQVLQETAQILGGLSQSANVNITGASNLPATLSPGIGTSPLAGIGGNAQTALLAQIVALLSHSQQMSIGSTPLSSSTGAVTQNFGNININGVQDLLSLYQQLNALAGLRNEYGLRGAGV